MMKRLLLSVSLALALCGAAAGHEYEHEGAEGAAHYREHALEMLRARQAEKAANSSAHTLAAGASSSYAMVDPPATYQTVESAWIHATVALDSSSLAMLKACPIGPSPHPYARIGANQGFSAPAR